MRNAKSDLLDMLISIDTTILKEEKALIHMQKQIGNKISKISDLRIKREKILSVYTTLTDSKENTDV